MDVSVASKRFGLRDLGRDLRARARVGRIAMLGRVLHTLLLLLPLARGLEEALSVEGNPHAPHEDAACCPAQALPPETLLPLASSLR